MALRRGRTYLRRLCALLLSGCLSSVAAGQAVLDATHVEEPPIVDGVLDDDTWVDVPVAGDFQQIEPNEGATATYATTVRAVYTEDTLYLAIRCDDPDPASLVGTQMRRDGQMGGDDSVSISIDPFNHKRNGYFFQVGVAGARRDALIENNRTTGDDWDGIWQARTSRDDTGWSVEIAIPFTTIAFDPDAEQWGFNVQRDVARLKESSRWAAVSRDVGITTVAEAGALRGLTDLTQGRGLTFRPFAVSRFDLDPAGVSVDGGADLFYRLSPQVTAALTINTDFAEAEVDDRRVNLSRFPLFFPEKRDFFIEESGVFEFGGIRRSPRPYYSRRIGIVGGQQKDILAGIRLTGRQGAARFGLLDVQMQTDDELGDKNLAVGRVAFDVGDESSAGLIVTHGDPARRGDNILVGADFNFRSSEILADGVVEASVWAMGTHTDLDDGSATNDAPYAVGGRLSLPNDPWSFSLFVAEVGEDFDPALGFASRRGRREINARTSYRWRPKETHQLVRHVDVSVNASVYTLLDGEVESIDNALPSISVVSHQGDRVFFTYENEFYQHFEPFEIVDGVTVPAGEYDNGNAQIGLVTSSSRPVAVNVSYRRWDFLTGDREDYYASVEFRPSAQFFGKLEYSENDISLREGAFIVRIARAVLGVAFSPDLTWDTTMQFDNVSDKAGLNSRLRWEFKPGHELFVVYDEGFDVEAWTLRSTTQRVSIKVGLTYRF